MQPELSWRILEQLRPENNSAEIAANLPSEFFNYLYVGARDSSTIAMVPFPPQGTEKEKNTAYNNARLISAAPDFFAACSLLVALEDQEVNDADTRWKQAKKDIRAALDKAIGKK